MLPTVATTRYVTPLREGGSLPGLVEADDLGTYVVKFRGAGQGTAVLVAEIVVGELARRLGLRVPDLKLIELDERIARYEPDEEVQDLLSASVGLNLAIDFLPRSLGFDGVSFRVDPDEAARVLWLDALVGNVDRSWRNPNLLVWHGQLWLIDHGAALWFHHRWASGPRNPKVFADSAYDVSDHVLAAHLDAVPEAAATLAPLVTPGLLHEVVGQVPDEWLRPRPTAPPPSSCAPRTWSTCWPGWRRRPRGCRRRHDRTARLRARAAAGGAARRPRRVDQRRGRGLLPGRGLPRRGGPCRPGAAVALDPDGDVEGLVDSLRAALDTIQAVCAGDASAGPAANGPRGERFRWLAAPRSTVVQPGPIHGGVTDDPAAELEHLLDRLVR